MEIIPKLYDTFDAGNVYCSPSPCDRYLLYYKYIKRTTMLCRDMHQKRVIWSLPQIDNTKSVVRWLFVDGVLHVHISEICGHEHRVYNAHTGELFTSFTTASKSRCIFFEKMRVWIIDVDPSIHIYDVRGQFLRDVSKSSLPLLDGDMTWHITPLVSITTSEGVGGIPDTPVVFFTNFQTNEYLKCDISGEKVEIVATPELSSFIQAHSSQIIDTYDDLATCSHIMFTMKNDYVVVVYNINTNVVHTIKWHEPGTISVFGNTYVLDTRYAFLFWNLDDVGGERTTPDFMISDCFESRLSMTQSEVMRRYIRHNPRTKKIEVCNLLGFEQLIALAWVCSRATSEEKKHKKTPSFMIRDLIFFFTRNALAQTQFRTFLSSKRKIIL